MTITIKGAYEITAQTQVEAMTMIIARDEKKKVGQPANLYTTLCRLFLRFPLLAYDVVRREQGIQLLGIDIVIGKVVRRQSAVVETSMTRST